MIVQAVLILLVWVFSMEYATLVYHDNCYAFLRGGQLVAEIGNSGGYFTTPSRVRNQTRILKALHDDLAGLNTKPLPAFGDGSIHAKTWRFAGRWVIRGKPEYVSDPYSGTSIRAPMWFCLALTLGAWVCLRWLSRRSKAGYCRWCGYNLTGNVSGVCPECGTALAAKDAVAA